MHHYINDRFLLHVLVVTVLLLAGYAFFLFKPRKSIAVRCEEDHTRLMVKIIAAPSLDELHKKESLIEEFDEGTGGLFHGKGSIG
jgi:Tfp pilus assembly protein PilO